MIPRPFLNAQMDRHFQYRDAEGVAAHVADKIIACPGLADEETLKRVARTYDTRKHDTDFPAVELVKTALEGLHDQLLRYVASKPWIVRFEEYPKEDEESPNNRFLYIKDSLLGRVRVKDLQWGSWREKWTQLHRIVMLENREGRQQAFASDLILTPDRRIPYAAKFDAAKSYFPDDVFVSLALVYPLDVFDTLLKTPPSEESSRFSNHVDEFLQRGHGRYCIVPLATRHQLELLGRYACNLHGVRAPPGPVGAEMRAYDAYLHARSEEERRDAETSGLYARESAELPTVRPLLRTARGLE